VADGQHDASLGALAPAAVPPTLARQRHAADLPPRAARGTALVSALIGVVVLAGWVWDLQWAKSVAPGWTTMKPNTAVALVLLAVCWFVPRRAALAAAAIAALVAGASLVEGAAGLNLRIDELLFTDAGAAVHPGRMAAMTGACLLVLATCVLLPRKPGALLWVQAAGLLVLGVAALALLGYLYGVRSLYAFGPLSTMSLHSALALLLLAAAVLLSVPRGLAAWALVGRDAGALLLRRVLPITLVVLPLVGYGRVLGERAGWHSVEFGAALHVIVALVLVTAASLYTARALAASDVRRAQALATLQLVNEDLEGRVRERAEQIQDERARRIRLEERQRLAADLHDVVIQRLYAAGLTLETLDRDPAGHAGVETAIERIDDAIRGLREAVTELKRPVEPINVAAAMRAMVDAVPAPLQVELEVRGVGNRLPDDAARQLLAAAQEAVSNAVRHADANRLTVDLEIGDADVVLTVADDGVGIDPAVRSMSGLHNLRARAHRLGGRCDWRRESPHGTTLTWRAPLPAPPHAAAPRAEQSPEVLALTAIGRLVATSASADRATLLAATAAAARDLARAESYSVITPCSGQFVVTQAAGLGLESLVGTVLPGEGGLAGQVFATGNSLRIDDAASAAPSAKATIGDHPVGPSLLAPLRGGSATYAVIGISRHTGRATFTAADDRTVAALLGIAGLLMDRLDVTHRRPGATRGGRAAAAALP
jgi:signal transduction histidine kinase